MSPRIIASSTAAVIVFGAGPAGSSTAAYLAMAGLDVLVLPQAALPRGKVFGAGLPPRPVRQLTPRAIPTPAETR